MPKTKMMPVPAFPPGLWAIWCPACAGPHYINTGAPNENDAQWTGPMDIESPTFMPSVNIAWGYLNAKATTEEMSYYLKENIGGRCHFYVRQGVIEYQCDCTHHLASKSCVMAPIEAWPKPAERV